MASGAGASEWHLNPASDADCSAHNHLLGRRAREGGSAKVGQLGAIEQRVNGGIEAVGQRLGGREVDLEDHVARLNAADGRFADAAQDGDIGNLKPQFSTSDGNLVRRH